MVDKLPMKQRLMIKITSFKNIMTVWAMVVFTFMVISTSSYVWGIFLGLAAGINGFQNLAQKYIDKTKLKGDKTDGQ